MPIFSLQKGFILYLLTNWLAGRDAVTRGVEALHLLNLATKVGWTLVLRTRVVVSWWAYW